MSRASGRRGLLISALLLLVLLVVLDLLRQDSLLRGGWDRLTPDPATRLEQGVREIQRTRGEAIRR